LNAVVASNYTIITRDPAKGKLGLSLGAKMGRGTPVAVTFRDRRRKVYPSATAAAIALNVSASTIRSRLKEWQPIQGRDDIRRIEYAEVQE